METWEPQEPIQPRVCEEREFLEIAEDFSNPCEIFREAISNAFDVAASEINIRLSVVRKGSRDILRIEMSDNGHGMGREDLQAFFDLGNSTTRGKPGSIGEKGHGTKIYYKSSRIEVITNRDGNQFRAEVQNPYDALAGSQKPVVNVSARKAQDVGTRIIIEDYNHSIRDKFTHAQIKDYVLWFTKFGSVEREFGIDTRKQATLKIKGIDVSEPETLPFGHPFPKLSKSLDKLLDEYKGEAPDFFVKKWLTKGRLRNFPDIEYAALFYLEGDSAKRSYNPMIRGKGRTVQQGMYQVQHRYGLWLCKDFIPVQPRNEWIVIKGGEFTRFHAFLNCQGFRLTANRGSVMNTPPEILDDIQHAVTDFFRNKILASSEYADLDYLEGQAAAFVTQEKDESDFEARVAKLQGRKVATFKGVVLVEPENEVGVLALVTAISCVEPKAFPFRILDYVTYRGYDALATVARDDLPLEKLSKGYIEFKFLLQKNFNHLFKHLTAVVCWRVNACHGDEMADVGDNKRLLKIAPGNRTKSEYTKYFLDDERTKNKIEVFVLEDYVREVLRIEFAHRAHKQT